MLQVLKQGLAQKSYQQTLVSCSQSIASPKYSRLAPLRSCHRNAPFSPMGKANLGKKASAETRTRMSESHKRYYETTPHHLAWPPEEVALLGTMMDVEVARRTGR